MCFNGLMMSWQTSHLIPGGLTVPDEHTHTHLPYINSRGLEVLIENFHNFFHAEAPSTLVEKKKLQLRPDVTIFVLWL